MKYPYIRHSLIVGALLFLTFSSQLILPSSAGAEETSTNELPKRVLSLRWTAYPWVPTMTDVRYRHRFEGEPGESFVDHLEMEIWYQASSGYFYPNPYGAINASLSYAFPVGQKWEITAGLGAGAAIDDLYYYIPVIGRLRAIYNPEIPWLSTGVQADFYFYNEGLVLTSELPVQFGPFGPGFLMELGVGFNLGYNWKYDSSAYTFKIFYGLGWAFR